MVLRPPSLAQRSRELLIGLDLVRFTARAPRLRSLPRGDGAPVLLVPALGAGDASLWPLQRFLRTLGHDARPIGLGRIDDDVVRLADRVGETAATVAATVRRPVALVGWSIGGVISREAARDRPDVIARIVTFGSSVVGGPSYTALAGRYTPGQLAEIRARIAERERRPIEVPITAIWSRNDGIVTPEACIDERSPHVENVEVSSTHLGMGLDPEVWSVVAHRLATPSAPARS
jgi:pimeloyl-ACP methyl ester carboxylesterase